MSVLPFIARSAILTVERNISSLARVQNGAGDRTRTTVRSVGSASPPAKGTKPITANANHAAAVFLMK